CQQHNNYPYTF
nr:immunoglobulin light chain junction region [Macaca mulatta]MOV65573.1 immunoglobulin light chain junction region [Macaca mulatta]MOW08091.1 immunoglobulin light chain junction region [Macaca mulatta]MOW10918.1 immunoglobulin light chain junction region [Macaca mulatta]MOW33932.1 immunoglobulin light chain junction region [Macaca mulatta]